MVDSPIQLSKKSLRAAKYDRHDVSQIALAEADHAIHLPMLGMMNSLNVATAASVVLYHQLAKRIVAAEGKP